MTDAQIKFATFLLIVLAAGIALLFIIGIISAAFRPDIHLDQWDGK